MNQLQKILSTPARCYLAVIVLWMVSRNILLVYISLHDPRFLEESSVQTSYSLETMIISVILARFSFLIKDSDMVGLLVSLGMIVVYVLGHQDSQEIPLVNCAIMVNIAFVSWGCHLLGILARTLGNRPE